MKTFAPALVLLALACTSTPSRTSSSSSSAAAGAPATASDMMNAVEDAATALKKSLTSLEVVVEGRSDVSKARDAYLADLAALDTRVQTVRDHAADLSRRRDAYLRAWLERSGSIQSSSLKEAAEKRRTELQTEFMTLGAKGKAVRQTFAPMHGALVDCARFLEADSTAAGARTLAPEYESIRAMEPELKQALTEYKAQLQRIADQLGGK
jgi:hypothetical protein